MKTLIIEDKEHSRKYLESLIEEYKEIEYLGFAETVKDGIELIKGIKPELVLFDIELPDGTSFDILNEIKGTDFSFIFISSHDNYAIKAFQYNAIDYLLKPVEQDSFNKAITKILEQKRFETQEIQLELLLRNIKYPEEKQEKIILNTTDIITIVNIKDIIRLESDNNYTYFHLLDGRKILVSTSLKTYENLLKSHDFFRIHQSHIINMKHMIGYHKKLGEVLMIDNSKIVVSVRKQPNFIKLIKSIH